MTFRLLLSFDDIQKLLNYIVNKNSMIYKTYWGDYEIIHQLCVFSLFRRNMKPKLSIF